MGDMVEVTFEDEVVCTGELAPAPYMFWHGIIVDTSLTDMDKLVERLQATQNAHWEGYPRADDAYMLLLPPIFKINKIATVI